MPILVPISPTLFVALLLIGSALLAAWTLVRYERVRPRTLGAALAAKLAALLLLLALPSLVDAVDGAPAGRLLVVVAVALPIFTYFFVAAGWFARAVLGLFGR
jgi:ABC-type amino acid transport system permease subunit